MKTKASTGEERDDALAPLLLAVERASSEAQYAERRYMAVDPDNRLIARTLEADWEKALRKLETQRPSWHFVNSSGRERLVTATRAESAARRREVSL
jgi:hypothetical protein